MVGKTGIQYIDCGTSGGVYGLEAWILSYGWWFKYCSIRLFSYLQGTHPGLSAAPTDPMSRAFY